MELADVGFLCESRDTRVFAVDTELIVDNFFDPNNTHIYIKKGALGVTVLGSITITGNKFNNTGVRDIKSDGYHKYVTITGNNFIVGANPSSCHVDFGAGGNSTGWVLVGNTYSMSASTRYLNLPADAIILDNGNGESNQLDNLRINTSVQAARLTVKDNSTYRGDANVAAAFGLDHTDQSSVSAAILLGAVTGTAPFIAAGMYGASNATASPLYFKTNNTVRLVLATDGRLQMGTGAFTVINANFLHLHRSYTVATVPSASGNTQCSIYVSDGTSNKRFTVSDGTNWRCPDGAIVS